MRYRKDGWIQKLMKGETKELTKHHDIAQREQHLQTINTAEIGA